MPPMKRLLAHAYYVIKPTNCCIITSIKVCSSWFFFTNRRLTKTVVRLRMFVCLPIYLSVCLSLCLLLYLHVYPPAASIWFEIWGSWIRVQKISISSGNLTKQNSIFQANFRKISFFSGNFTKQKVDFSGKN